GETCRNTLEREGLVAVRPHQAADHLARLGVERVHAADACRQVKPGCVLPETRQHARGANEGHTLAKAKTTRPAGQARNRAERALLHHADFAVAAVVYPQPAGAQPRGVRSCETTPDRLGCRARGGNPPTVYREVPMAGTACRERVGRGGEV